MEKTIISKSLITHIDLARPDAWKSLAPLSVASHVKAPWARSADVVYEDGGLTAYDIGHVNSLRSGVTVRSEEPYLKLQALRQMDEQGEAMGTYLMRSYYDEQAGQVLSLQGGYLMGNFKYPKTPYQVLPERYPFGVTFNTWIRPREAYQHYKSPNDGIFLFLGARAENKYATLHPGDEQVQTSQGNDLGPDHPEDPEKGVIDNMIAFRMDEDGRLGYRTLGSAGIYEEYSESRLADDDWVYISINYQPYEAIPPGELNCYPRRQGDLSFYVNGSLFARFRQVDEFYFTPLFTEPEKQLTVPYTLSWGGGTPGLKHAFHFKQSWVKSVLNPNIFSDAAQGSFDSGCDLSGFDFIPLTFIDEQTQYEGQASLRLEHWHLLPVSEDAKTLFTHSHGVDVEADQTYEISLYVQHQGLIQQGAEGYLKLLLGEGDVEIIEANPVDLRASQEGMWHKINLKFKSIKDQRLYLQAVVDTEVEYLLPGFVVHIDRLHWAHIGLQRIVMDEYSQHQGDMLLAERYFDGSFNGDIQQLSIYDRYLNAQEINHNYRVSASRYGHIVNC